MAKKQKSKKKLVPYSEVQDAVAAKRGRDVSQGKMEQIDELHSLINSMAGYAPVEHPLRKHKAKAKAKPSKPSKRGRGRK